MMHGEMMKILLKRKIEEKEDETGEMMLMLSLTVF